MLWSSFLLENSLYSGVKKFIMFLKLVGNLDKMTIATPKIFKLLFQESLRIFVFVWSYKLLFHTIYIALTRCIQFKTHITYAFLYLLNNTTTLHHLSY